MFSRTFKRSVAIVGVVAGLLTTAVPALAASPAASHPGQTNGGVVNAGATTQGIIMRDGGVCDPIRHMGC